MREIRAGSAAWWDFVFLGLLLVAMSSQVNLGDIGQDTSAQGYVTKQLKIALPDIALLLNLVWFLARTTLARGWKRLWWPPLPVWALGFALALSLVHSPSIWSKAAEVVTSLSEPSEEGAAPKILSQSQVLRGVLKDKGASQAVKEGVAETIQFGLYFLVAPLILANLLFDRREVDRTTDRREFALKCFGAGAVAMIALALFQAMRASSDSPRALFGSPNAFAAWFAISLPLLFAWSQSDKSQSDKSQSDAKQARLRKLALPVAVVGALAVMSLWSHLALVGGLIAMAILARGAKRVRLGVLALLVAGFVSVLWAQSPRDARRQSFVSVGSGREKVKKQYIEWYAASGWAEPRARAFGSGVGPGNYQGNIGTYYSSLPNEEKMPPDSNNLYLVQAVSLGVLGLSALIWVVAHFARRAHVALKYLQRRGEDAWLPLGVLGSLASWALVNFFHATIVRGTGLVLALLLALAAVSLGHRESDHESDHESEREDDRGDPQVLGGAQEDANVAGAAHV